MKEVRYNERYHVRCRSRAIFEGNRFGGFSSMLSDPADAGDAVRLEDGTAKRGHVGNVSGVRAVNEALTKLS